LRKADIVLLVGTPLDFRLKFGKKDWNPKGRLIQVENDHQELNRNREADIAIVANARQLLEALTLRLRNTTFQTWLEQVREFEAEKKSQLASLRKLDGVPINHFRFAEAINQLVDEDTIVIGDGGDIVSACAKVIDITRPGQWLGPGPLGCLGVGIPFAIAAQNLFPKRKVLVINGDGSFGFNGFEFDTAIRFGLPVVSIVGNDAGWGQIRGPQINMVGEQRAVATSLAPTRYDQIVVAMGGYGEHIDRPEAIVPALERAFTSGIPACVDVSIDPEGMAKSGASMPYVV
jgi:acetolactate synthase-1/2/3 large subunit